MKKSSLEQIQWENVEKEVPRLYAAKSSDFRGFGRRLTVYRSPKTNFTITLLHKPSKKSNWQFNPQLSGKSKIFLDFCRKLINNGSRNQLVEKKLVRRKGSISRNMLEGL